MNAYELKEHISQDRDRIIKILENLNCKKIDIKNKDYIYASFPDGDNPKGISLDENLNFKSFSRCAKGDIFSLICNIKEIDFFESVKYLHNLFNLKLEFNISKSEDEDTVDILSLFREIKNKSSSDFNIEEINTSIDNFDYLPYINKEWIIKNGILEPIRKRFDLGFSPEQNRIVIPHKNWHNGEIVGIIGRTCNPLYKELDIPKYFPIRKYEKGKNLYGLYENYLEIQRNKIVVIYEAEKSVIRRSARFDNTGVALCCKHITEQQVNIIKSLHCEIVVALDNDCSFREILEVCDRFYPAYKVGFIKPKNKNIGLKDSIADLNNKQYNIEFENRQIYNDKWRDMLETLRKKGLK